MEPMDWLDRQYRALLVREGELLDGMLALARIGCRNGREFEALMQELVAIGHHQSSLARSLHAGRTDPPRV